MSASNDHGRPARRAGTATLRRRRVAALTLVALTAALAVWIAGSGGGSRPPRPRPAATGVTARAIAPAPAVRAQPSAPRQSAPQPGSLPQTHAYPSGSDAHFRSLMSALWAAIVSSSPSRALPAFFPKGAYLRLKAINSAGTDWSERLVRDFGLDIAAAHALLGGEAARARLIGVDVPSGYGHWVPPGACYNGVGYYELPNARIVYSEGGSVRSFGIASMISWRGVWYVVHLGAILRSGVSGTVDEPASGRGSSLYSGTC
jgi:hypothetical protein